MYVYDVFIDSDKIDALRACLVHLDKDMKFKMEFSRHYPPWEVWRIEADCPLDDILDANPFIVLVCDSD
jgi:hypothetical protein